MRYTLTLLILSLLIFPVSEASATVGKSSDSYKQSLVRPYKAMQQNLSVTSRKQAAKLIKDRFKAKVLSISSSKVNGNPGYRAKLLGKDGTVFYAVIDAKTGRIKRL